MTDENTAIVVDTAKRYGLVTRLFHWSMAYLLLWQFVTLLGWRLIGDGPFMRTVSALGPAHGTVGILVFCLVMPRLVWALTNRSRRPANAGLSGLMAKAVHGVFYLLMIVVPALALTRAYGSGKGFALWDVQLIAKTGQEVKWLVAPANLLHGPLAWTLAILIAGHIMAAAFHGLVLRDGTIDRMTGRRV